MRVEAFRRGAGGRLQSEVTPVCELLMEIGCGSPTCAHGGAVKAPPPAELVRTFMFSNGKRWLKEAKTDQIKTQRRLRRKRPRSHDSPANRDD